MQFDNMLQKCFNCSYRGTTPLPTRIFEPSTHWAFTCSKSVIWNPQEIFVKGFIFKKLLGLLPVALLKKHLHRYFSRSLIIDIKIPIFTKRLSVATSKIHKFLTSFIKSVLVCWNRYYLFYQNVFSTVIRQKKGACINFIKLQN